MNHFYPSTHGLLDLYDCSPNILCHAQLLENTLIQAARAVNANILFSHFHQFGGHGGVTGVLLLAESHISIHTWVEHCFAAVDIFLCGKTQPEPVAKIIQAALQAKRIVWKEYPRGQNLRD